MRRNRQRQCVMIVSVLVMFFSSGLTRAQDPGTVLSNRLVLPELIQEVLARNPELVAARKQWEAVTNRITQARSLDDPILSLQLWNFPQNFNVMQTQNNIFGLSQNLPFPGKLALKGNVASRSAEMTEQAVRAKELELVRQFVAIANAKFRAGKGSQADVLKAQVELSMLFQHLPVLEQRRETVETLSTVTRAACRRSAPSRVKR